LPSYAQAYGWANFLFLCNIGVILGALGVWTGNRELLSASAIASLLIGAVWTLDFGARAIAGVRLLGVTDYMWEERYPLFTRGLSFYHLAWPIAMLACLARVGYSRRGWSLQAAIAVPLIVAGRFAGGPAENINFAWSDPVWGVELGPPAVHLLTIAAATLCGIYGAAHLLLQRFFTASTDAATVE